MGLYHFYARTYSPALRRWLQRDPLGYVDGVNLYGYVGGNPLRYVDPFGMAWWDPIWQALPPGFHNWAAGGGHIPVVDPGTAQDVVQTATEIAGGFAPIPAGKGKAVAAAAKAGGKLGPKLKAGIRSIGDRLRRKEPPPNRGIARPHGGSRHNSDIDKRIQELQKDPKVKNIRKNQAQVDKDGSKVGENRPDIQYDKDGIHHAEEFDTDPARGEQHRETITKNDPNTKVTNRPVRP